jgi:LysR family transcriptional regulator, glycine cleavage system transcriptional activator
VQTYTFFNLVLRPMRASQSLPPLILLHAFEAAARRLSFRLAAEELCVTPSAISQRIQNLESNLGVALFQRRTRSIALTSEGQALYEKVHDAFELMRTGTAQARARASQRSTITIGLLASFASRWLVPRLPNFQSAHPAIDLQLRPDISLADVAGGEVDMAIRYGRGAWPSVRSLQLMKERLSLVCAPALLEKTTALRSPRNILSFPLLTSHTQQPFEWQAWADHFNVDLNGIRTMHLHDYNIVVEAALAGQGIAMGRHRLISRHLRSGALIQPLPHAVLDDPAIGWWLVLPHGTLRDEARAFHDWLVETAKLDSLGDIH